LVFEGAAESTSFTELRFAVSGRVESIAVTEGQSVKKGSVLATVDRLDREELLAETRRRLSEARSARKAGGNSSRNRGVPAYLRSEMEKRIREAEASAKDVAAAKRALNRAGKQEGEEGMNRVLQSRSFRQGRASRSQHRYVEDRTADERLAVALIDDLEQRESRLKKELAECDLVSPIDGIVVMIGATAGQAVQTRGARAALVLIDPLDLVVRFSVPEKLGKILGPGEDAWLQVGEDGPSTQTKISGIDETSYQAVEGGNELVRDVLIVPPLDLIERLKIGQSVRVALRR